MRLADSFDLAVVGGGINGAGIARDAAGRGLSVVLVEAGDLAGATSSASSKLVHGGLRYLETLQFRLVREALGEREVLMHIAPHLVRPLRFVLPHAPGMRPFWTIRAGLWLYDHLARRGRLPGCEVLDLARHPAGRPLARGFSRAFAYSDCWAEDARLVVANAVDAAERGAQVLTRTRCASGRREAGLWHLALEDGRAGREIRARALVNATGPWVARFSAEALGRDLSRKVRLVRGSHIVLPRLSEGEEAYILQNDDGRIVFVIPFEGRWSLVGTTDMDQDGPPEEAVCSDEEEAYLRRAAARYFGPSALHLPAVQRFAGVRPLYRDAARAAKDTTRDYRLELEAAGGEAPLLTVYGGKLTTYRRLAEHAMALLAHPLGAPGRPWTAAAVLPGGELPDAEPSAWAAGLRRHHPFLTEAAALRLAMTYGSRASRFLAEPGPELAEGLYEGELAYLRDVEFARTAEDVLWRRTRLGLADGAAARAVERWFAAAAEPCRRQA